MGLPTVLPKDPPTVQEQTEHARFVESLAGDLGPEETAQPLSAA